MQDERDAHELIRPMLDRFAQLGLDDIAGRLRALTHGPSGFPLAPTSAELLTPAEAAERLGLRSVHTVLALTRSGQLPAYDRDGQVVLLRRSVDAFQASPELERQRRAESQLWSMLEFLA